jgi:hypothetical protein
LITGSASSSDEAVTAGRQSAAEERVLILEPGRAERNYWRDLWHYRELFAILAWRDVAVRYKQTVIGVAWAVLRPLLTMVVFTIVFGKLAGLPSDGAVPYALLVFSGMLPWFLFASVLSEASGSLVGNANLIGKVYLAGMLELGGSYAGAYLLRRGLFMPWELGRMLSPDVVAEGLRRLAPLRLIGQAIEPRPRLAHAKVAALEASFYMRNQLLRDTDWSSMAHGLEVRVPLVDHVLLNTVASAACRGRWSEPGAGKAGLASSPSTPLPERVLSRAKTGFTTPIGSWLQNLSLPALAPLSRAGARPQPWARQWAERLAVM